MKKLLTLLAFAFVALTGNAQSTQKGDVNGDGDVSVNDVAMIVNYILGVANDNIIAANADINGDGEIDINDVMGTVSTILEGNGGDTPTPDRIEYFVVGEQREIHTVSINTNYIYTIYNSNPNVATAEVNTENGYLIVTGLKIGKSVITVRSSIQLLTIEIRVSKLCPDDNHPHMIDLGLPSGTKWACCNVGADKPEAYGGYYAWGETEEKSIYTEVSYLYSSGVDKDGDGWYDDFHFDTEICGVWQNLGSDIAGTQYDVAHVKWGGSWVMPSNDQNQELIDICTYECASVNGVKGGKFTSKTNGGSIFLPGAGFRTFDIIFCPDAGYGYYWSSTQDPSCLNNDVCDMGFDWFSDWASLNGSMEDRFYGHSVRPVSR